MTATGVLVLSIVSLIVSPPDEWRRPPAGREMPAARMTTDEAWAFLGSFGKATIPEARAGAEDPRRLYRRAQAFTHPDRHGGDRELWDQVEQAARVLGVQP